MTGRGRPRKAKSPDTETNQGRSRGKVITEERQNGTTREQEPKEHKKEKPSVQSPQKEDRNHSKEVDKLQRTPADVSVPGAKPKTQMTKDCLMPNEAKTRGKKAKSPDEAPKKQQDAPNDAKAKTCARRAIKKEESAEEITKMQPETPKDTTKTAKAKTGGRKVKSPEKIKDKAPKKEQGALNETPKVCVPHVRCKENTAVDTILSTTLEQLKIRSNERSKASEVISNPDEFDVMLPIPVDRVDIEPFGEDGAFYSVALKRDSGPLKNFQIPETGTLSASKMLEEFRNEVKKSVKAFEEWEVTKKKKGCPAVTLTTTMESITISLDVVLCLMVKSSWPSFTKEGLKIESWLGTKVKKTYKYMPYYLVPKYEGKGTLELDGVLKKDIWRISFSHIEKAIMKNHGSEKTCCEKDGARCCRKDCLKLLKHLLSLLKERNSSFDKFCSYHAKTTLLRACCSRTKDSEWSASSLSDCFQLLLEDFMAHLKSGELYNFFIPTQNLLSGPTQKSCSNLAQSIKEQCDEGFPIFK